VARPSSPWLQRMGKKSQNHGRRLFGAPAACYCNAAPPAAPPAPPVKPPPAPPNPPLAPPFAKTCAHAYSSGSTQSGVYTLRPRGGKAATDVEHQVYCDMSTTPAGQSLFDTPTGSMAFSGSRTCSLTWSNDDADTTYMWVDFTGRVKSDNGYLTNDQTWFTIPRNSYPSTGSTSNRRYIWGTTSTTHDYYPSSMSSSMGNYARPVPFPGSGHAGGTVVWLGASSVFFKADGTDYSFAYPSSMSTACKPAATSSYNTNAFVTDGVNTLTVVRRSSSTIQCLTVLTFDWSAATYSSSMLTATTSVTSGISSPANWHGTEQDAMGGDMLWTVKGKPCYYSNNRLNLGTSMQQPFAVSSYTTVSIPSGGNGNTQHGMDIFLKVDTSGTLHVGDWGHDNGGMFGCGNDNQLGSMQTTIKLAVPPPAPPPPSPPPPSPSPPPPPSAPSAKLTLPLSTGWAHYGGDYGNADYLCAGGIVVVSGLLNNGAGASYASLSTLPTGCRPDKRLIFNMNQQTYTTRIDIFANGVIKREWGGSGATISWVSLSSLFFHVGDVGTTLSLSSGWSTYGGEYGVADVVCATDGLVSITGLLNPSSGASYSSIATLATGCRPDKQLIFNMNQHSTTARVDVKTSGLISASPPIGLSWISLSGIVFYAGSSGTTLPLSTGWSHYGGTYGTADYTCSNGRVVVSGLLNPGSGASYSSLATLPVGCRPSKRLVFNCNQATATARVDVLPSGLIKREDGTSSLTWISLSGIVFYT